MSESRSRNQQEIFVDLYRNLRKYNPDTPESAERLDPILRLLLQLYAHQLSRIDRRLDMTWDMATDSLVKSVCPNRGRWPIPAFTVMRCRPTDPVVEVDTHTRFFYKERREGGKTFFFSPHAGGKVIDAQVKKVLLQNENRIFDLTPAEASDAPPPSRAVVPGESAGPWRLYVALDYAGLQSGLAGAKAFIQAQRNVLKQLRWGYWYPGSHFGSFQDDSRFCPGLTCSIDDILNRDRETVDWGGFRRNGDLFDEVEDNFVLFPGGFTSVWEPGPVEPELGRLCRAQNISTPPENEHHYWIRVDLPDRGSKRAFAGGLGISFDSLLATNKNEMILFKHTGGNRVVEIEIAEHIDSVLEIVAVVDSNGNDYRAIHDFPDDPEVKVYATEERRDHLVLWFDYGSGIDVPPDSITVTYAVTDSVAANGIEAGKINDLYESHPGITSVSNITAVKGAIPAKSREQVRTEVSLRLRQRDRALTFDDIAAWARVFDPRIKSVKCRNGVQRFRRGLRKCIIVTVTVDKEEFYSDDETTLLQRRLRSYLKARSTVNTQYDIEVEKT